jgi:hypothetical protein
MRSTLPALVLALASCAIDAPPDRAPTVLVGAASDQIEADRAADEAATADIPTDDSVSVCEGGHYRCYARRRVDETGRFVPFAATGLAAADLQSAYKLNVAANPGATIAIIDAYNYANAESDLGQYRSRMGLSACTKANGCLTIVNQTGQATPLPNAPPAGDDWTVETALDLDMASAACPNCKLLLIEAQDDQGDGLFVANDTAATMGATVASNSWGGPDDGTSPQLETRFNHPSVGYFVATGDNGYNATPDYPSTSAYVTGVGGTSLVKSASSRGWAETTWTGGGSSCSTAIGKPAFQSGAGCPNGRAASDVAAVADPNTGVIIYNSANGGLLVIGGTSAASPLVAAIYALTKHSNAGPSFSYKNASMFFDVTSGSNGSCTPPLCTAGTGWDGPTGNGTPNGAMLAAGADAPPQVSIISPGDGASVSPGFTVLAGASDDVGVTMVELRIDGALVGTASASPYTFNTDRGLAAGNHVLEATAYDTSGQTANASITISVGGGGGGGGGGGNGDGSGSGSNGGGYIVGGCAAGGSAGSGALLAIALALAVRRRRARA